MKIKLYQLDKSIKNLLTVFLLLLTAAVLVGLFYLSESTNSSVQGTIERWNGSRLENKSDTFAIAEQYPKPVPEMLLTTHNHLFGFAFIFVSVGLIFVFNSTIGGSIKNIIMLEPFISVFITFTSIWLMRFFNDAFVYIAVISSVLMYSCYFIMVSVCIYELKFKRG